MNDDTAVFVITFIIFVIFIGVIYLIGNNTETYSEYSSSGASSGAQKTASSATPNTYYCCNENCIWKSTSCWAHDEFCCEYGDAGMNCDALCKTKGFASGTQEGTGEGTDDDTFDPYHCVCS